LSGAKLSVAKILIKAETDIQQAAP